MCNNKLKIERIGKGEKEEEKRTFKKAHNGSASASLGFLKSDICNCLQLYSLIIFSLQPLTDLPSTETHLVMGTELEHSTCDKPVLPSLYKRRGRYKEGELK